MKYYEIKAVKSNNQLIERFVNGVRYVKYIPFNPQIVVALQEQFKNKPVEVELKGSWIVITKTGHDEQLAKAGASVMSEDEVTEEALAQKEMEMLKKAGYNVSLNIGETDD